MAHRLEETPPHEAEVVVSTDSVVAPGAEMIEIDDTRIQYAAVLGANRLADSTSGTETAR